MRRCDNLAAVARLDGLSCWPRSPSEAPHRNGAHENQRNPAGKRTRSPARPVSRDRQLGDFSGSHSRQRRELDHDAKLRLQRRRRPLRLHFGIHRLLRLRPDDARTRLHRRRHPPDQAGLAALCRPYHPVRHLYCFDQLSRAAVRRFRDHQRVQCRRPGRSCDRDAAPGFAAQVQAGQSRRASALHRPDGVLPAGPVDHAAPAQLDDAGLHRVVAHGPAVRLEFRRPIPPAPGTSTPTAGRCCLCSAHGARSAGQGNIVRLSMRPSPSIFASPISSLRW